jgi:hypothetical protein
MLTCDVCVAPTALAIRFAVVQRLRRWCRYGMRFRYDGKEWQRLPGWMNLDQPLQVQT